MIYVLLAGVTALGGFIQGVTGFGAGILMMLVLPSLFALNVASGVSGAICIPMNIAMWMIYRKHVSFKKMFFPTVIYLFVSSICIHVTKLINLNFLKVFLGIFLSCLGVYYLFFAKKLALKDTPFTMIICSTVSGLLSGFFGIGGPFMVLYFLAACKEKEEYLGAINFLFAFTGVYQLIFRIFDGIMTVDLIPVCLLGIVTILVGSYFGKKVVNKIDGNTLKKYVYIFLIFAGIITTINAL